MPDGYTTGGDYIYNTVGTTGTSTNTGGPVHIDNHGYVNHGDTHGYVNHGGKMRPTLDEVCQPIPM